MRYEDVRNRRKRRRIVKNCLNPFASCLVGYAVERAQVVAFSCLLLSTSAVRFGFVSLTSQPLLMLLLLLLLFFTVYYSLLMLPFIIYNNNRIVQLTHIDGDERHINMTGSHLFFFQFGVLPVRMSYQQYRNDSNLSQNVRKEVLPCHFVGL